MYSGAFSLLLGATAAADTLPSGRAPSLREASTQPGDTRGATTTSTERDGTAATPLEVVVQGESQDVAPGPRDTSVAGSIIRRDRLVGPGLQTQDVLRAQPGVAVTESGGYGSPATAAIRGATAADTPVYLGGARLNDDVAGTADLSLVPLWLLDHVEVYRGHPPIDADRFAPGGAIFFEPRRPTRTLGGVGYYGGSLGVSKNWVYIGTKRAALSALVGVSADRASNRYSFVNDQGTLFNPQDATVEQRRNSDERTLEGWGLARAELGRGVTLDLLANGIVREQGVPRIALLQTRQARGQYSRVLVSVGLRVPLDDRNHAVLQTRTAYLQGSSQYEDPLNDLNLRSPHLDIKGTRLEQSVGAKLEVTDSLRLHPLLNLSHERIEREPDNIPLGRTHREFGRAALGGQQRLLEWLTLNGVVSAECHHTGAEPDALCNLLEPTGRVGLELGEGRFRVLANWGRYVRVPTLGELYGVSGSLHGNANLVSERSYSADLGVRTQVGRKAPFQSAYIDAFVFARWAEGLIAYQVAGERFMVPYNIGHARLLGAELLTGVRFTPIVCAELSTTLLDPRDTTPGRTPVNDVLPYRSRLVLVPRVRADWKAASDERETLTSLGGELRAILQSSRYADSAGLGVIAEQLNVDLEVYASWLGGMLTTRGRISDLFDSRRTDLIGYPLPGRSGYFGMETTW